MSTHYDVLKAVAARLEAGISPRPPVCRVGYVNYQSIPAFPAIFITTGPGSTVVRQQHAPAWEYRFIVRVSWVTKGTTTEPLEMRGLSIYNQLLTMFDADPTLGGLVMQIEMVGELGSDEGELALAGADIGPFWQDFLVKFKQAGQSRISG